MSDTIQCSYCDDEFDDERSLDQHQRSKHPEKFQSSEWQTQLISMARYGMLAVAVLAAFYAINRWGVPGFSGKSYPSKGDHWHARYEIDICGNTLSPLPRKPGDVHTHGKGKIHIHPHSPAAAGSAANLTAFFDSFNGEISDKKLVIPMHGSYKNGDKCPNGEAGKVAVFVNGKKIPDPGSYVPQEGDYVRFTFQTK